jgi:hypothetical protein
MIFLYQPVSLTFVEGRTLRIREKRESILLNHGISLGFPERRSRSAERPWRGDPSFLIVNKQLKSTCASTKGTAHVASALHFYHRTREYYRSGRRISEK